MVTASNRTQGGGGGDVIGDKEKFSQAITIGRGEDFFGSGLL